MTSRKTLANAIRFLAKDAVEKANSGHPGMPMGMADIAEVLWRDFLKHNPQNPNWINRDRFVLSNGHGSMLQYALLHLTGYDLSIEDLQSFRQLHSKTPGHPEVGEAPGIETTTGPLGQGLANAVGMALAEKMLAAKFNQKGLDLIDHYTYAFAGDGCLMEGVSHEVCSLAGVWGLGKLIVFWDDNEISIDGKIENWFGDNPAERFKVYGWDVIDAVDGHDADAVKKAIEQARANKDQPTLICCKTIIGYGSPNKAGTAGAHGAPMGKDECELVRKALDWKFAPFEIPDEIYQAWDAKKAGTAVEVQWNKLFADYQQKHPELYYELTRRLEGKLPEKVSQVFDEYFHEIENSEQTVATRKASGSVIAKIAPYLPEFLGGSADLTGSNLTNWPDCITLHKDVADANYIYYGVREFGMSAIMNGIALYGGFIPFGGTFLVFQSYCANATRMSALMKQRVIYVFTHDSIGLGEDGPTHQPIMEMETLRATPNMQVWRPCDALETVVAWRSALYKQDGPTSLILSRQGLPQMKRSAEQAQTIEKGGYILCDCGGEPELILIATGSEVQLAMAACEKLSQAGHAVRVVSMPCVEMFLQQGEDYQQSVLPTAVSHRIAIEAASPDSWYRFVGFKGRVIGMDTFGASAPAADLFKEFGFTVEHVYDAAQQLLKGE